MEARENLSRGREQFPEDETIRYNLPCYECQLGNLKAAWDWMEKAIDLSDSARIKPMALEDPDLKPLWAEIPQI